jgi:CubicO group peptidase (beta-lactamase class C family)
MKVKLLNIKINLILISLLFVFSCSQNSELKDSLAAASSKYTAENTPPGLAISVIKEGSVFWSYSYGYSDIENEVLFDESVIMNIGSVSKTITTTAVLQLWEKGELDLDTDVNHYLDFPVRNPNYEDTPITIKHLLTHTASIKDGETYSNSYQCGPPTVSLSEWIRNYFTTQGRYYDKENNFHSWQPGKGYKYSNVAYGLLGLIVEEISQQPFDDYCQKNIFEPLKMNNSAWFRKDIDTLKQSKQYVVVSTSNEESELASKLIDRQIGDYYELCNYSFYNYPDGLFKTTMQELSHFMIAMMNEGQYDNHQILKPSTVSEAFTLQVENYDIQGLGWKKINYETFSFWGHSGRDPGVRTHMYFDTGTGIGIILFQNNDEGTTIELIEEIYSLMLEKEN